MVQNINNNFMRECAAAAVVVVVVGSPAKIRAGLWWKNARQSTVPKPIDSTAAYMGEYVVRLNDLI